MRSQPDFHAATGPDFGAGLLVLWILNQGRARKESLLYLAHSRSAKASLGPHETRLRGTCVPSLNAATRAALAGRCDSYFAVRFAVLESARESSTPRCLARIAIPVTFPNQGARREYFRPERWQRAPFLN